MRVRVRVAVTVCIWVRVTLRAGASRHLVEISHAFGTCNLTETQGLAINKKMTKLIY